MLERVEAFKNLPEDALLRLERAMTPLEPRHGAEVFSQGSPADSVYAIVGGEGSVRIGAIDRNSKRLMVEVFGSGDIFGEVGVIDAGTRTAAAVAEGRVRLMRIGAPTFMAVLNETPALGLNLTRILSRRLRRTFSLFQDATFETLEVRLARQLIYLADIHGRRTEQGLLLASRLRQPDLADLLGATTRSIISILNDWRARGVVQYHAEKAQVVILDIGQLKALVPEVE